MPTSHTPAKLSRSEKATISRKLHENLVLRAQKGPAEPALDAFIPQVDSVANRLVAHVLGKKASSVARVAHADRTEKADVEVDTWARHIENFVHVEGNRKQGPHVESARLLHAEAFPIGLAFLEDRVPDQNAQIRGVLTALRAPEHAATLAAIGLPPKWVDSLEAAVEESDQAYADRTSARGSRGEHVLLGKNAEKDWLDIVGRLRKYVDSRAPAGDVDTAVENRALLAPLTDAIAHAKALAAARATRRAKKSGEPAAETTTG